MNTYLLQFTYQHGSIKKAPSPFRDCSPSHRPENFKYDIAKLTRPITTHLKMSNRKNPITTTRFPNDPLPMFNTDDAFHMDTPNTSPDRPSSTRAEPSSSHPNWDLCMARLGPPASSSPTPDLDLVHPQRSERRTELLESKSGFFLADNSYISHWECCKVYNLNFLIVIQDRQRQANYSTRFSATASTKSRTRTRTGPT